MRLGDAIHDLAQGPRRQLVRKRVQDGHRGPGRERIETPAGTFDCVGIEPVLKAGGIFKSSGRLVIWVTDDERRMPVLMKSKVAIGSVSVVLVEARAGG